MKKKKNLEFLKINKNYFANLENLEKDMNNLQMNMKKKNFL